MTIPEEASVTREGAPLERMRPSVRPWGLQATGWKLFFRRKKWGERMAMLMMGARARGEHRAENPHAAGEDEHPVQHHVGEAAPQSWPPWRAGARPSLRTKHSSTLFIKKAGENSKITRRYVWGHGEHVPRAPKQPYNVPGEQQPHRHKERRQHRGQVQHVGEDLVWPPGGCPGSAKWSTGCRRPCQSSGRCRG